MLIGDVIEATTKKLGIPPCPKCIKRKLFLNRLFLKHERVQADGSIIWPRCGPIPEIPEGYVRSEHDPYHAVLALDPCEYREEWTATTGCCRDTQMLACNKYVQRTDRLNCRNCQEHGND